jgi:hypothetical protein
MTTAMMKLISELHSCPQHCLQCQLLLCNLSCQPLQHRCSGWQRSPGSIAARGVDFTTRCNTATDVAWAYNAFDPENDRVIVQIQRSVRSRRWRRQGSANAIVGHAGCSGNIRRCGGDKSSGSRKRNHCRSRMHRRSFWKSGSRLGSGHASENALLQSPPTARGAATSLCLCC